MPLRQRLRDLASRPSRELFVYLVRKEIKVKYKNSFLGFVWSMLNPALTLAVFYVLFTYFLPNGIPNFVIYMFSATLDLEPLPDGRDGSDFDGGGERGHRQEGGVPEGDPAAGVRGLGVHVLPVPGHRHGGVHVRFLAPAGVGLDLAARAGDGRGGDVLVPRWRCSSPR